MVVVFDLYVIQQLYFIFWFLYVNERLPFVVRLSHANGSMCKFRRIISPLLCGH